MCSFERTAHGVPATKADGKRSRCYHFDEYRYRTMWTRRRPGTMGAGRTNLLGRPRQSISRRGDDWLQWTRRGARQALAARDGFSWSATTYS